MTAPTILMGYPHLVFIMGLVEERFELDPAERGVAEVRADEPGFIRVAVDAPTRQLLVLTESYYPGWQISLDGDSAQALRVNGDFLACLVGPGTVDVRFHFDPDSWRIGKLITAAAVLLTLVFHIGLFGRLLR